MFSKSSECNNAMPYEYLCTETCGIQEGYGTSPFCATMGQPLIYYCQTPQQKFKQKSGNVRKDNKNYFTKAFQWYTQEHVPHRDEPVKKRGDVKGFANWLDSKYDQFLQGQCDSCYKVKHTSITEAYRFQNEPCETRRKKFRVKSPWRKKRGHKDTDDVTSKCSLHYIMKPKDISRPASETNDMSKAMMMSSEVVLSRYSHSCTSLRILREPSVAVVKRSQEVAQSLCSIKSNKSGTKSPSKMFLREPNDVVCLCSKVPKRNAYTQSVPWPPKSQLTCCPSKLTKISHPAKIEIEFEAKPSPTDIESSKCQCSKEFIPKADAECQFQTDVKTCSCGSDHSMRQETIHNLNGFLPKNIRLHSCECDNMDSEKCPLEPPLTKLNQNQPIFCNQCIPCKRMTTVTDGGQISNLSNKTTPDPNGLAYYPTNKTTGCDGILSANPTTTNDGVQTSNHSIRLDKDGAAAAHPLFMKIVFADKLCKF